MGPVLEQLTGVPMSPAAKAHIANLDTIDSQKDGKPGKKHTPPTNPKAADGA